MTAQLALGTYRCRAIPEAVVRAAASGAQWVDTAPNYATGRAQILLAPALSVHPLLNVSTKTGYFTAATGTDAVNDGVLDQDQAAAGHSLAPDYVRWQTGRNREQLRRDRLDLVLLHNPERAHPGDRPALHRAIRDAFAVLEEAVAFGHVAGYGVATWAGLEEEAFTVGDLLALAAEAAGGRHHLAAVQLPVSLVMMTPIAQALHGRGPIPAAVGAGLRVMASAPLHGGELPGMVDQEFADLIRPGLTPAQACILAVASCPGVTNVLLAASGAPHWKEAADAVAQPSLTAAKFREIIGVLASA
ncbi:putative oxidoreductase [Streptomyces ambofaciens ATCC 23877]|uniref:Putative oxidoreductase n=1 Tax=Streptomyces ambofaciens (strain ATCC 23877 / 3486 / DSM 40053 / JCM 4204 / NBRC 12836 / NRRL B-2516) TaxID=278992 RepID=Q1RRE8_STRA7|nr:aldo/keto reductase [Streptomyces ambofaciens]AKZ53303.1 putative oxidoreductase [Streptomyces ambofaciens ATCC 23877]CAI78140.1 putative oxidoreductase [Streptomyces ambofaciens ATCC 23877]CAJ89198.1 putative oxidoreductase [Streptomyces ambofaciens ATCC 23877]